MKRLHLNFLIDALAFVAFLLLLSTGVLLRYQLPPGSGGLVGRGSGTGTGERAVSLLWGWTRHEWGDIHFWIACALLVVLAVHLLLHWRWIICVLRGKSSDASGWRFGLGLAALCAVTLLAAAPWVSSTEQRTRSQLRDESPPTRDLDPGGDAIAVELRGSMSLDQISQQTGMSVAELIDRLGLPDDVSATARVGPLLRSHGLHLSDLRQVLQETADVRDAGESE